MARIELDSVTKRFGDVVAVDDLSLDIEDGSFMALLGPSGCGKSTTMNMLAGLLAPTEGEIRFDGERVNEADPGRRNVGFVFQSYAIFTHMSAYENIAFGLRVKKLPKEEVRSSVDRVARLLGIETLLERPASRLSVNDMQKVAIGRSMITNPAIFLLDEPFSNLDAAFRTYMRAEMKKLQRDLGQTMIYVTHDQVEAMAMADEIAIMNEGLLQQVGAPDEIYGSPRNRFVAHFVGSTTMNFLPADVHRHNGALAVRAAVPDARPVEIAADRPLPQDTSSFTLGIRPEDVSLLDPGDTASDARGVVELLEPLGPRTIVHIRAGDHDVRVVVPPTTRPRIGEATGLRLRRDRIHVFDDATGLAIR